MSKEYIGAIKARQRQKQKPSEAWSGYCVDQQSAGKCELIQCLMVQLKGKVCKDKWFDKHCDLRGKK